MQRIYLDNAATTWPKPEPVYEAVERYQRDIGASAGRGAYREAGEAHRVVDEARLACAQLLDVPEPRQIIFGCNATDLLNLAIVGMLRRGDRVVSTVVEHNSVLRPLAGWREPLELDVVHVGCDAHGYVDLDEFRRECQVKPPRIVAINHGSNVSGAIQPVREMAAIARDAGAFVVLDAAQSLGHVPLTLPELDVDLLAASAHKGLLGPAGTGLLAIRPGVEQHLRPWKLGGTGGDSDAPIMPEALPARYEAGSHNVPALAGVTAAVRYLQEHGVAAMAEHEAALTVRLMGGLADIPGVTIYGAPSEHRRLGVVSFAVAGYDPQEFATMLDASAGVQARAGLHCAPLLHRALGSHSMGGLVRLSIGWANTLEQIDAAIAAVEQLSAATI